MALLLVKLTQALAGTQDLELVTAVFFQVVSLSNQLMLPDKTDFPGSST